MCVDTQGTIRIQHMHAWDMLKVMGNLQSPKMCGCGSLEEGGTATPLKPISSSKPSNNPQLTSHSIYTQSPHLLQLSVRQCRRLLNISRQRVTLSNGSSGVGSSHGHDAAHTLGDALLTQQRKRLGLGAFFCFWWRGVHRQQQMGLSLSCSLQHPGVFGYKCYY